MKNSNIKILKDYRNIIKQVLNGHLMLMYNDPKDMPEDLKVIIGLVKELVEFPFEQKNINTEKEKLKIKKIFKECSEDRFNDLFIEEFNQSFLDSVSKYHKDEKIKRYKENKENWTQEEIDKIKNSVYGIKGLKDNQN